MYVYEEMIDGKKLTEIINTQHENVKYLPGHKLPPNIVSIYIEKRQTLIRKVKIMVYCSYKQIYKSIHTDQLCNIKKKKQVACT